MSEEKQELTVYQAYQRNIRVTEQLQTEIIRGAKEGEDVGVLLLKCAEALSLATNTPLFHEQVARSLRAVYGKALGQRAPLETDLQETRERLARIEEAEAREEQAPLKEEMQHAIRAHRARIRELEERLGQP